MPSPGSARKPASRLWRTVLVRGKRAILCHSRASHRTSDSSTPWRPANDFERQSVSVRSDGARREAFEEAGARIEITGLLAVYNVVRLGQVQLFYSARLLDPEVVAGPETLELDLFEWGAIPWDELAFPSVHWVLRRALEIKDAAGPYLPALGP